MALTKVQKEGIETLINNNADNRVITGSGTANTLNGESTLTFDGSLLKLQVDSGEFRIESANGVDQLSVDSDNGNTFINGNVGIGTTSPSTTLTVTGTSDGVLNLDTSDSRGAFVRFGQGGSFHNMVGCADGITSGDKEDLGIRAADNIIFASGGSTERMRIDSSGGLRVGTTSHLTNGATNSKLSVANSSTGYAAEFQTSSITGGYAQLYLQSADTTTSQNSVSFARISGGSVSIVGTITTGTSSTSYNTSSDYRLKENAVLISDGITRLKTLKPYRFNWKVDPSTTVDGFFAHEVTAVPEAVTGTKDEISTDEDGAVPKGEPIYQSIDQSKLVPLLVAAVQELIAKVETLETA